MHILPTSSAFLCFTKIALEMCQRKGASAAMRESAARARWRTRKIAWHVVCVAL